MTPHRTFTEQAEDRKPFEWLDRHLDDITEWLDAEAVWLFEQEQQELALLREQAELELDNYHGPICGHPWCD